MIVFNSAYDPSDYEHLPVSQEIKELFEYITRYTPQTIDLEHKLKPFIPDFIPAVGDIDAFLKVYHQLTVVFEYHLSDIVIAIIIFLCGSCT